MRRAGPVIGPAFKPNPEQDALLDRILAAKAPQRPWPPRPSKDGDDK